MTVGSECVHNFKKVINDLGKDIIIRYPLHLHKAGELINKRYPGTVEIEDASDYDKNEETMDDKAPEGMGMDDIDWESFDFECND